MFTIADHKDNIRRAYQRRMSSLLATHTLTNDTDTVDLITETTEDFAAFLDAWAGVEGLYNPEAFEAFVDTFGMDVDTADAVNETVEAFDSAYIGIKTPAEYAEDLADESGMMAEVPEFVKYHIDWDGIGRDMVLGGDVYQVDDFLFHSNW